MARVYGWEADASRSLAYTRATGADPDAASEMRSRRAVSLTPRHVVTFAGIIEEEETGQVALQRSDIGVVLP